MQDFQTSRLGFPGSFSPQTGYRFGIEPGYNFLSTEGLTLGGEFETGVIYNHLASVTEGGEEMWARGDYYQVPLLGNLVLKLNPNSFVVPYIGVGGGGDASTLRLHSPGLSDFDYRSGEVDPAVQGMAGVRFRIERNIALGVGYKFLAAFPGEGSYVGTHAAEATLSIQF